MHEEMAIVTTMTPASANNREGGEREVARELTRVQIYKHVTRDRLLEINDMLSLEPRRSKIAFTLLEFDENYRVATRVRHYADAPDFKLVCWDILNNCFDEWTDHKGTPHEDILQARTMTLRKDSKYRQPFVIKIDNGIGETMPGGAVKMVREIDSLTLLLSERDARRLAQTVLDYIRDWETINFRKRQEAQTVLVSLPEQMEHSAPASSSENRKIATSTGASRVTTEEEEHTPKSRRGKLTSVA
jgi:hypothetical protein